MAIGSRIASFLGINRERAKPFSEQGVSGTQIYGGWIATAERNPSLIGPNKWRTYDDIAVNCPVVAASIRYFTALVTKAAWSATASDEDSEDAKAAAEWLEKAMEAPDQSWSTIVARAVTARYYGFSVQEWAAQRRGDGTIVFRTIENRPQATVERWDLDERGSVIGIVQRAPDGTTHYLPREKCVYLVDNLLTDAPDGLGLLRHAVEPATRLKAYQALEQQGFERDLRGIPIGYAPMGAINDALMELDGDDGEDAKKQRAGIKAPLEAMKNFVTMQLKGSSTGAVLDSTPYFSAETDGSEKPSATRQWEVKLLEGPAPGLSEMREAKRDLNFEIARIFGTEGMVLGSDGSGSLALSKDRTSNLILAANSVLDDIVDAFNKDFRDPLWRLNGFDEALKPSLVAEKVDHRTVEEVTTALRDLAQAGGVMLPDDPAINHVRGLMGVPKVEVQEVV
ncbi:hypothetical protein DYI37_03185 [Fulvimarina endophytica]|uniref:Phage portal protein n=1 Tax=Fulvimarina endophytica TaxID=2293836 RepID=A0A371XB99_9HYPH|nr:hypothetical protein [Fulvimarina endophytica]RFC66461.1 hypothetical protein DYI37_03185 [Fulvimarina endophytica]